MEIFSDYDSFVTCDLLDDNPEKGDLQVVTPLLDGKFLKVMVRVKPLVGGIQGCNSQVF